MSYLILYLDPSEQNRPHKRFAVMWTPERTQPVLCGSSESGGTLPWLISTIISSNMKENAEYAEFAINHLLLQQLHHNWMFLFEFNVTQHGCNSVKLKQPRSCSVSPLLLLLLRCGFALRGRRRKKNWTEKGRNDDDQWHTRVSAWLRLFVVWGGGLHLK